MKIGLMGFDFFSPNKGCEALTYSFINLLLECCEEDIEEIVNFSYGDFGMFPKEYPHIKFTIRRPHLKKLTDWGKMEKEMSRLDAIFDVTFGDGFSDIYGKVWNATTDIAKELAIRSKTPLVLLPQTYGPFKERFLRKWAISIINRSSLVYSRDTESALEYNLICKDKIKVLTDMAFALPYNSRQYAINCKNIKIGINVSSLLFDDCVLQSHKYEMKVNYKDYIVSLMNMLINMRDYCIYLIPHVIDKNNYKSPENDVRVCGEIKKIFPDDSVIIAPEFDTPIEAKSYIANMDVFIGARMHATIGAVSAGIATIPFAYSKKFESMFGNLNYHYVLDGRKLNTEEAVAKTMMWIQNKEKLQKDAIKARDATNEKLDILKKDIKKLLEKR